LRKKEKGSDRQTQTERDRKIRQKMDIDKRQTDDFTDRKGIKT
jgi:hypothetical protein